MFNYFKKIFKGGFDILLFLFASQGLIISPNDRKLLKLKTIHEGKRCFIIGNGPSLLIKDLDRLKNEITFASNKIYLAFDQTDWRPTYYAAEDQFILGNNFEDISNLKGFLRFFPRRYGNEAPFIKDGIYFRRRVSKTFDPGEPGFGLSPIIYFYWGHTITYILIQFANYMGIKEIYLLGIDFDYKVPKEFEKGDDPYIVGDNLLNHFHPNYLQTGVKVRPPNLHLHALSYKCAKRKFIELGGKIYNATRGGKLEIFPRVDFDTLFNK